MNCNRCGKWAGFHATLPGQPTDHLCMCPPKPAREWVGLTDEEIHECFQQRSRDRKKERRLIAEQIVKIVSEKLK